MEAHCRHCIVDIILFLYCNYLNHISNLTRYTCFNTTLCILSTECIYGFHVILVMAYKQRGFPNIINQLMSEIAVRCFL
jgi:hypothetical protein